MRWALIVAVGLPAALAIMLLIAKIGAGDAERSLRWLRYVLLADLLALLIMCAVGYAYETRARARAAKLYQPPGRLIDVGGYHLHLNCAGEGGPTVVLDYGLEGSYLDWDRVQPEIARFVRVCSYDRAGYGWSEASPRARVPSAMSEELHTLLHTAGEKAPYIIVAHSYGSVVGQMFAHKFPNKTAGLVLVDGMNLPSSPAFPLNHRLWLRSLQWTVPFGLPRRRHWCGGGSSDMRRSAEAANCRSRVFAAYYREWSQMSQSAAEIRAITSLGTVPLIVISRDPTRGHDASEEARHTQQQHDALNLSSNSRLIAAEGSGHNIPGERPEVVIEAVRSLVRPPAAAGSQETP